jgi:hypothetical protein
MVMRRRRFSGAARLRARSRARLEMVAISTIALVVQSAARVAPRFP